MKNILKFLLLVALLVYVVFAFTNISAGKDSTPCKELKIMIADSSHAGFITVSEVERLLRRDTLYPIGRPMNEVDGTKIETALRKNSFIREACCCKMPNGRISINVWQRLPVMRVKSADGEDYYVDKDGRPMDPQDYTADLVVATGHVDKRYAKDKLMLIGRYLHANPDANDLIQQIDVDEHHRVTLIPRIGCEAIHLGEITDSATVAKQFRNLRAFYGKVLPQVGWNAYREVSLEFTNQIIAKK